MPLVGEGQGKNGFKKDIGMQEIRNICEYHRRRGRMPVLAADSWGRHEANLSLVKCAF